jgi:hypothetical protein
MEVAENTLPMIRSIRSLAGSEGQNRVQAEFKNQADVELP